MLVTRHPLAAFEPLVGAPGSTARSEAPADHRENAQDALPALFAAVPPTLFRPLAGRSAPLSWGLLARLYVAQFEGQPGAMLRAVANEYAEDVLRASPDWDEAREEIAEGDEGDAPELSAPDEAARVAAFAKRLVDRLARAGWIHFEFDSRAGGEIVNFHPYASRLLRAMMAVARDEQPLLEGYAHRLRSLLEPRAFGRNPGLALREVKQTTLEFVLELKTLNQNIGASTRRMIERAVTASAVLEEGFDRYQPRVMRNLHRLKTSENFFRIRPDVRRRFDEIEHDEITLERAAHWAAEQSGSATSAPMDVPAAAEVVREDVRLVRRHLDALPEILDDIDRRNARFTGIARRKLRYLLQQHQYLEAHLQGLLADVAVGRVPDAEFELYRADLLHDDFLWTPPAKRERPVPRPLARAATPDAGAVAKQARADYLHRTCSRRVINARVRQMMETLGDGARVRLDALPVGDDQSYTWAIHMVAYGLDGESPFRFERATCGRANCVDPDCAACRTRRGSYVLPNGVLVATALGRPAAETLKAARGGTA